MLACPVSWWKPLVECYHFRKVKSCVFIWHMQKKRKYQTPSINLLIKAVIHLWRINPYDLNTPHKVPLLNATELNTMPQAHKFGRTHESATSTLSSFTPWCSNYHITTQTIRINYYVSFYLFTSVARNSDSLVIQILGTIIVIPCIKITYLGGKFSSKI